MEQEELEAHDAAQIAISEMGKTISKLNARLTVVEGWIAKYKKTYSKDEVDFIVQEEKLKVFDDIKKACYLCTKETLHIRNDLFEEIKKSSLENK